MKVIRLFKKDVETTGLNYLYLMDHRLELSFCDMAIVLNRLNFHFPPKTLFCFLRHCFFMIGLNFPGTFVSNTNPGNEGFPKANSWVHSPSPTTNRIVLCGLWVAQYSTSK